MNNFISELTEYARKTSKNTDTDADEDDKENGVGMVSDCLERIERRESAELVQLVTTAISQHKLCNCCKARKKMKGNDAHLRVENLTDELLRRTGMCGSDYEKE